MTALLHDFDYEIHPTLDKHPQDGAPILREEGYPEVVIEAVLSHAEHLAMPRDTPLKKTLFACDELSGFVHACGLVRPTGLDGLEPKSVREEAEAAVVRGRRAPRRGLRGRRAARARARRAHRERRRGAPADRGRARAAHAPTRRDARYSGLGSTGVGAGSTGAGGGLDQRSTSAGGAARAGRDAARRAAPRRGGGERGRAGLGEARQPAAGAGSGGCGGASGTRARPARGPRAACRRACAPRRPDRRPTAACGARGGRGRGCGRRPGRRASSGRRGASSARAASSRHSSVDVEVAGDDDRLLESRPARSMKFAARAGARRSASRRSCGRLVAWRFATSIRWPVRELELGDVADAPLALPPARLLQRRARACAACSSQNGFVLSVICFSCADRHVLREQDRVALAAAEREPCWPESRPATRERAELRRASCARVTACMPAHSPTLPSAQAGTSWRQTIAGPVGGRRARPSRAGSALPPAGRCCRG